MEALKLQHWTEAIDPDGTRKYSCTTSKGLIEISYITNKDWVDVLCLPTHYTCSLGCTFCHLTKLGSEMSKPIELNDFPSEYIELLENLPLKPNVLLSFMGAGEPTLNVEFVVKAWRMANLDCKREFQVAISTMVPSNDILLRAMTMLRRQRVPAKIHYSLHAARHSVRKKLIPGSNTNIDQTMRLLEEWNKTPIPQALKFHRTESAVEVHYTMIECVNDSEEDLQRLSDLLAYYKIPVKFIVFNAVNDLEGSSAYRVSDWAERLKARGISVSIYSPPGKSIGSSCGMFDINAYK